MNHGFPSLIRRLREAILRGAPRALVVRMTGRALVFALALVLARVLGLEGFGIYTYATAWVSVLVVAGGLGYRTFLLRQTAIFTAAGAPERILSLMKRGRRVILMISGLLVAGAALFAGFILNPIFLAPILVVLPAVIIRSVSEVWEGVLQGLGRVDESYASTYVIYPVLMLVLVGLLELMSIEVSPTMAAAIYLTSFGMGAVVLWKLTHRHLPQSRKVLKASDETLRQQVKRLLPFTSYTLVSAIGLTIGTVLLGLFDRPDAVGLLQAAIKLTEPVLVVVIVLNASLSHRLAGEYAQGSLDELRPIITRNVRTGALLAFPIAVGLVLARDLLLSLFGAEFEEARTVLMILIPAVLFQVSVSGAAVALIMSRHVFLAVAAVGTGVLANATLCLLLIPSYGANGAAIALGVNIVLANGIMAVLAWRTLGLNTTVFSLTRVK